MKKFIIIAVLLILGYVAYSFLTSGSEQELTGAAIVTPGGEIQAPIDLSTTDQFGVVATESSIKWEGSKKIILNYFDRGTINVLSGTLGLVDGSLAGGEVVIDMSSIVATSNGQNDNTKNSGLEGHLKSADFFDVAVHPTATIVMTKVEKTNGANEYSITGDVTIKGKTNSVTFPATVSLVNGVVTGTAKITLDRSLWDVRFGSESFFDNLGDNVINDNFTLDITLVAKK